MSIRNCDDCCERDALILRYKKDRDEALSMAESLRGRLKNVTDTTTHHNRIEHEMFERLEASRREVERLGEGLKTARADLDAERLRCSHAVSERAVDREEVVRLASVVNEQQREIEDLSHRLREHETMPIVRVWPESAIEHAVARLVVEARAAWRGVSVASDYALLVFVLVAPFVMVAAGVVWFVRR